MATVVELPLETYKGPVDPDWCPGCGDFGVLRALQRAAGKLGIHPKDLMVVSGIGCSSNLPGYIHAYGFHGLHGRALAQATGMKLGNHDLHVVITGGDGDGYGIGIQHFIHSMRRNIDQWFKERVYTLEETDYEPTDYERALVKVREWGDEVPIGRCHQTSPPTYEDGDPALKKGPLVHHKLGLTPEQRRALVQEFM